MVFPQTIQLDAGTIVLYEMSSYYQLNQGQFKHSTSSNKPTIWGYVTPRPIYEKLQISKRG